jgi:MraZ protein
MAQKSSSTAATINNAPEAAGAADQGFIGNHPLTIDDKLRITVPSKFKAALQRIQSSNGSEPVTVIATIGLQRRFRNILVFPPDQWQEYISEFEGSPVFDIEKQTVQRLSTSVAIACDLDSHGRVRLDKRLVELAKIRKQVTAVGCGKHFELWDSDRYDEFVEDTINHVDSLLEAIRSQREPKGPAPDGQSIANTTIS